jgi:hypothetical protein
MAGNNEKGDNLSPVSFSPVIILSPVSMPPAINTNWRTAPRIFVKIRNCPDGMLRGRGKLIHENT